MANRDHDLPPERENHTINTETKLTSSQSPPAVVLIRLMVGTVFFLEGIQKFLYPEALGAGRFAEIGIPAPGVMGPFVGMVETVCGALLLVGFFSRLAAIALLVNISVAILSTKIPILLGHGFWTFTLAKLPRYGFLSMMHEARTDFSMLLGLIFLLIAGAGVWSIDAVRARGMMNHKAANTST